MFLKKWVFLDYLIDLGLLNEITYSQFLLFAVVQSPQPLNEPMLIHYSLGKYMVGSTAL
jgi:hypothetical protein